MQLYQSSKTDESYFKTELRMEMNYELQIVLLLTFRLGFLVPMNLFYKSST